MKKQTDEYQKRAAIENDKIREETARAEFNEICKKVHHLASTKAIPGVYNPQGQGVKPQAFSVDVEEHLKTCFKSTYKWKAPSKEEIEKQKELTKKANQQSKQGNLGKSSFKIK